ncbi:uncharacterized protein G2W53_039750 [Senna tora]|uniref:Uncharacterized protein n=1 Tax=Senna tora TaxID=362788 RepID=A0A834W8A4_9FABA|nr:uncharacterized protein G2W53_039750 [Senna tora]
MNNIISYGNPFVFGIKKMVNNIIPNTHTDKRTRISRTSLRKGI